MFSYILPNGKVAVVHPGSAFDPSPLGWARRYHAVLVSQKLLPNEPFDPAVHRLPAGFMAAVRPVTSLPPRASRATWRLTTGGLVAN